MEGSDPGKGFRAAAAVLALAAVALAGCSALQPGPHEDVRAALERSRDRWREAGPADYTYTVSHLCFCPTTITAPVVVTVEDGEVVDRRYAEDGAPVDPRGAEGWMAVEGLFRVVEGAVDRDADSIEVEYDARLGYPTSIRIDYSRMMADEEATYTASDLRAR